MAVLACGRFSVFAAIDMLYLTILCTDGRNMTAGENSEKEVFLAQAESFLSQQLYQRAQDLALDWLRRFPHDSEARVITCHAWTRLGKLDKVKQMLEEVDEAIFGMSQIYARMGDICRQSGLNQEAAAFYRRFVALNPESEMAREVTEKIRTLSLSRDEDIVPKEEEEEGSGDRHLFPGLQSVTMAQLYLKQGHPDVAAEMLESILQKDENNQRALAVLREMRGGGEAPPVDELESAKFGAVLKELNHWLQNIERMRGHAA